MFNNPQTSGLMNIASQQITPNPMGSRSGVDILSIQNDLKNMSDEQLGVAMQSGTPTYLVASEKNRRVNMRKDFEARKSAQEGTVVQDLFKNQQPLAMGRMQQSFQPKQQGLGSLPGSSEQPVMQMAEGGLIDLIKQQEAYQSTMYDDVGNQAIGYGYNLSPQEIEQGFVTLPDGTQVPLEGGITEKDASSLLEERLGDNFRAGSNILKEEGVDVDSLSPNVRNALQDLTYQTGGGIFNKSPRLVEALRRNDEQAIAEELRTTGRLVNGEILPSTEQRANTRADMVADGSGSVFDTLSNLAGNLSPISTAEAQTVVNTPVFNNPLGMSTIPVSTEEMSSFDDGQTAEFSTRLNLLTPTIPVSPTIARSQGQVVQSAIEEYDRTVLSEQDKDREIGLFESLFEEDSDKDRGDVINALITQYDAPSRLRGEKVTQGGIEKGNEISRLLGMARRNKDMAEKIIDLARSGEPLTVENVKAITGEYVAPEMQGQIKSGMATTPNDINAIANTQEMLERTDLLMNPEENQETGLSGDDRQSARQLAFLEAALRVGSSDSPTLQGALGEAVPAIESYRDELDNISQRKYRDAQAKYYGSGGTKSQQYNSILSEAKSYLDQFNSLPSVGNMQAVLRSIGGDDAIVVDALTQLDNLGLKPAELDLDSGDQIKAITLNALTKLFAKRRGINLDQFISQPASTQADTINNLSTN